MNYVRNKANKNNFKINAMIYIKIQKYNHKNLMKFWNRKIIIYKNVNKTIKNNKP